MFSTADCSSFDRCIAVATNKKTKSFESATYMKPLALWEWRSKRNACWKLEGDSHARWTDAHSCCEDQGVPKTRVTGQAECPSTRQPQRRSTIFRSLPGRTSQFSPSDKPDVLFSKEFAKSLTSKEVEIALAPGGAPSVAFKRGGLHFVISEG
jgi:hypothetical protein